MRRIDRKANGVDKYFIKVVSISATATACGMMESGLVEGCCCSTCEPIWWCITLEGSGKLAGVVLLVARFHAGRVACIAHRFEGGQAASALLSGHEITVTGAS